MSNSVKRVQQGSRRSPAGWLRLAGRGTILGGLVFGGLALLVVLRVIERPLCGQARPVTPYITQCVCKTALIVLGIGYHTSGAPMTGRGAVVSNHASWLDIFVLNARKRVYFVSKAEVAKWPFIGWLARATGTVFIRRDPKEAKAQQAIFEQRLLAGHRLLFFPEGTSTDGHQVLPFKTTLFQAFLAENLRQHMQIQPVTVIYHAPKGENPAFYGWWGAMGFAPHLAKVLAARRGGRVEVQYHPPLSVRDYNDRKALASDLEVIVRQGMARADHLN